MINANTYTQPQHNHTEVSLNLEEKIHEYCEGDTEMYYELAGLYKGSFRELHDKFNQFITTHDLAGFRFLAHKLHSSIELLSLQQLRTYFTIIRNYLENPENTQKPDHVIQSINAMTAQILQELNAIIKRGYEENKESAS
ncbi:hypothetical protein [Persicobacter psychrovividus]|uniref:HPt domain-containing protein n=1 Tax=Persicobacter psychrovividus TaxID=387638 RepID=A0ABN6LAT2_9BACT|nr:hypothetical protein PEPS_23170 [Persicobacter psychrovividus]